MRDTGSGVTVISYQEIGDHLQVEVVAAVDGPASDLVAFNPPAGSSLAAGQQAAASAGPATTVPPLGDPGGGPGVGAAVGPAAPVSARPDPMPTDTPALTAS